MRHQRPDVSFSRLKIIVAETVIKRKYIDFMRDGDRGREYRKLVISAVLQKIMLWESGSSQASSQNTISYRGEVTFRLKWKGVRHSGLYTFIEAHALS